MFSETSKGREVRDAKISFNAVALGHSTAKRQIICMFEHATFGKRYRISLETWRVCASECAYLKTIARGSLDYIKDGAVKNLGIGISLARVASPEMAGIF